MTRFYSRLLASGTCLPWFAIAAFVCITSYGSSCPAQHHAGHHHGHGFGGGSHFGGGGVYNNSGAFTGSGSNNGSWNYSYGGFNASAPLGGFNASRPLGGVSFGNGFGTATYNSQNNFGVTTYGNTGVGYNHFNHGVGYGYPVIWSTPIYNYTPSVFGYGTGVFSPNFPSGNYVSNGYIGFVPNGVYNPWYNPWCQAGWPYAVGVNSYFPGTAIAPTVLMLNMNLNMQAVEPPAASYSLLDPRLIDQLAPAVDPNGMDPNAIEPPPIPQPPRPDEQLPLPDAPQLPVQPDGVPVLNEFDAMPRDQRVSSLTEKIQSLRYQASGDDAFHKSDYATADVFYATAIRTAPDRRAPYLRMAIARIALSDFPTAARYLKAGLMMESDASRPWCTAEELYGQKVAERARTHGGPLWNWLAERPMSADRLLLAGTFQKLRGYNKTADEMLTLASHEGPEAILVSEVTHLTETDIGQRAVSHDLERMIEQASAQPENTGESTTDRVMKRAVEQAGGIFMRGKSTATRTEPAAPAQQPIAASDIDSEEARIPFEIPLPEKN